MVKRVSLKDIADKVGVSTALVSYVINGQEKEKRVGAEVVKKIKAAAEELNYMPNQIARSLRKGTTKTIGLIVADIANPFFGLLARYIEDEAEKFGYNVIFCSSDEDCSKSASLIETLLNRQVDGFIIVPAEGCDKQIERLKQNDIPLVLVDRYFPGIATNYVVLDNYQATYDAISHLINNGFFNISMVAYKTQLFHMKERIRGYSESIQNHLPKSKINLKEVPYCDNIEITRIMNELLKAKNKPDAIVFATNALTMGGLYYIQENGIKVPEELAIIGFDGTEAFDFFYAPLSYIQQPLEEMGKESVRILVEQINGSEKTVRIELKHKLIQRLSSKTISTNA